MYSNIDKTDWFYKVLNNFAVLRAFFITLHDQKTWMTSVEELRSKPEGVYAINLIINVESLLSYWHDYLLFACNGCNNHVHVCSCIVNCQKDCQVHHSSINNRSCSICQGTTEPTHHRQVNFEDVTNTSIVVTFSEATIELFFYKFPSHRIVSEPTSYYDFINTLKWHSDRLKCRRPFVQTVVVKKVEIDSQYVYTYVSGVLAPTLDAEGYVLSIDLLLLQMY